MISQLASILRSNLDPQFHVGSNITTNLTVRSNLQAYMPPPLWFSDHSHWNTDDLSKSETNDKRVISHFSLFSDCEEHHRQSHCQISPLWFSDHLQNLPHWNTDHVSHFFSLLQAVKTVRRHRPQLVENLVSKLFSLINLSPSAHKLKKSEFTWLATTPFPCFFFVSTKLELNFFILSRRCDRRSFINATA